MIGTSIWEYLFIRASILFLRYLVPLSALCYITICSIRPFKSEISIGFAVLAAVESLFLVLVYYPRDLALQNAASHPKLVSRNERRELFRRCCETIDDPERYISLWHRGAPLAEIRRDNVKG